MIIHPIASLSGKISVPGDKSISHRALILGALTSHGTTQIQGLLESADVFSTLHALKTLGIPIELRNGICHVQGQKIQPPSQPLDCGNSGTTLRLLMGLLASAPFHSLLIGDTSLSRRPMRRIALPLNEMGAKIHLEKNDYPPVQIQGTPKLKAISWDLPIASAQLKSSLLLAGLFAQGTTRLRGKIQSRDHTERMLKGFGIKLEISSEEISIEGGQTLSPHVIQVPGDFSSAAFWIGAALITQKSSLEIQGVSLNKSRTGLLRVLERMGARIETEILQLDPEPLGFIRVQSCSLKGTQVDAQEIPNLIDELPLLAVLATFAEGPTEVRGAEELRVKETDRIQALVTNLRALGVQVEDLPDGFILQGPQKLRGGKISSYGDHRIAMAFSIGALAAQDSIEILESECVTISYPSFYQTLKSLTV